MSRPHSRLPTEHRTVRRSSKKRRGGCTVGGAYPPAAGGQQAPPPDGASQRHKRLIHGKVRRAVDFHCHHLATQGNVHCRAATAGQASSNVKKGGDESCWEFHGRTPACTPKPAHGQRRPPNCRSFPPRPPCPPDIRPSSIFFSISKSMLNSCMTDATSLQGGGAARVGTGQHQGGDARGMQPRCRLGRCRPASREDLVRCRQPKVKQPALAEWTRTRGAMHQTSGSASLRLEGLEGPPAPHL